MWEVIWPWAPTVCFLFVILLLWKKDRRFHWLKEQLDFYGIVVWQIHEMTEEEGSSVEILGDNPEADSVSVQAAIEVNGAWTNWKPQRYYGEMWTIAVDKAWTDYKKKTQVEGTPK